MPSYLLGTTPEIHFTDDAGKLASGGKMHFKRNVARDQDLAVYQDAAGLVPYPNPITLSGTGSVGLIYYTDAETYYIYLNDSTDSQLIWEVENFSPPQTGSGPAPIESFIDIENLIPNAQLRFTWNTVTFNGLADEPATSLAPFWYFHKSNATGTDNIVITNFAQDRSGIEGDPTRYLNFECTDAGSAKSYKDIEIRITGVNTFNNRSVSIAFQGKSPATSTVEIMYKQHFGTGGAPSSDVITSVASQALTASFAKYSYPNITIATTGGKVRGTNNDDYFALVFRLPLAATAEIDLINAQINIGTKIHSFEYDPFQRSNSENLPDLIGVNDNKTKSGAAKIGYLAKSGSTPSSVMGQLDLLGSTNYISNMSGAVLSGSVYNASSASSLPTITPISESVGFLLKFDSDNPVNAKLNIDSSSNVNLVDSEGALLSTGFIKAGSIYYVNYSVTHGGYVVMTPGQATESCLGTVRVATSSEVSAGTSTNSKFIKLNDIVNYPFYKSKEIPTAWISFTPTSSSSTTIHNSFNVTGIGIPVLGEYRIDLSVTLTNANYAILASGDAGTPSISSRTTTSFIVIPSIGSIISLMVLGSVT